MPSFTTRLIQEIAQQLNAQFWLEPEYGFVGQVIFPNGKRTFFKNASFNINPHASAEIAKDKGYSHACLKSFGYPVAEGQTFFSDQLNQHLPVQRTMNDAYLYAKALGWPVIIKPNNMSHGKLVTKVFNKKELYRVARRIFQETPVLRIEPVYDGNDYRIVVLDQEIIAVYQRIALSIVGNGVATVRELLMQAKIRLSHRKIQIDPDDLRITLKLAKQHLNLTSVPQKDQIIPILDNANLSAGGTAIDLTDAAHPRFKQLARDITQKMGLRLSGIDILANDIRVWPTEYVILEVNASPGLDHYAALGPAQAKKVKTMYLKMLQELAI